MTRPPFKLQDDEARTLLAHLRMIEANHPLDQRDHRPFVRAFMRAVHSATGKTFSPAIYRRLLSVYAPERRPSTSTLAMEKERLRDELALERDGSMQAAALDAPRLGEAIRAAVTDAIGERPARHADASAGAAGPDAGFWRERAAETEHALADARAHAARLAGELLAAQASVEVLSAELQAARNTLNKQADSIGKLAAEVEESRRFTMRAIDDARGETRLWRERCQVIEAQAAAKAKEDNILLETFRQLAYQRGAAIPPILQKGSK
ncbi:hypothetical protein ACFOY5_20845 [Massilia aurea]|uniref:hypothetical protein n=1 Tax=Massilia aurea TaxID=373040 RepID=UPI0021616017|nr:hypothetical protein [Massilia aurea]MCS0710005.1 hypothetical protein [Massilia aurea]